VLAFNARCPHLGCAVQGAKQLFICPCHGSLFGLDGSVKLGPATQPLIALPVTFDGTQVVVKVPA
jgi:Rieske Fe-S protein